MSYKNLEVWQLARDVSIEIHKMSLTLPQFELYEARCQIRRASKSVRSNIVEGYGRRRYKREFIRYLIFSTASNDEAKDHLDCLFETGSLDNEETYSELKARLDQLGKKLYNFLKAIEFQHNSQVNEPLPVYGYQNDDQTDLEDLPES